VRIKLDENIPARLAQDLGELGHDVETVVGEALTGRDDGRIWQAAQQESRFFITQDLDFSDLRQFTPGSHAGLLLVRLRDPERLALPAAVREVFSSQTAADLQGCFIVITEKKLRVLRPPASRGVLAPLPER
jgi:predicted nuclease of predicted toxin-antitoxin system